MTVCWWPARRPRHATQPHCDPAFAALGAVAVCRPGNGAIDDANAWIGSAAWHNAPGHLKCKILINFNKPAPVLSILNLRKQCNA